MKSLSSHHAQYLCRPAHNHFGSGTENNQTMLLALFTVMSQIVVDGHVVSHPEDHSRAQ